MLADVQALLSAGDDVLSGQRDEAVVVTVGEHLRIERLDLATLIVVTAPPATYTSCHGVITACTGVLKRCRLHCVFGLTLFCVTFLTCSNYEKCLF